MVVQKPPGNSWSSPHTIHLLAVKTWLLRAILNQSATVPGFISLNPRCCKEQRMFFFHGSILMGPSFSVPVHSYSMSLSSMNLIILCLRRFKQIRRFLNNKKLTNEMFKNIMVLTLRMYLEQMCKEWNGLCPFYLCFSMTLIFLYPLRVGLGIFFFKLLKQSVNAVTWDGHEHQVGGGIRYIHEVVPVPKFSTLRLLTILQYFSKEVSPHHCFA